MKNFIQKCPVISKKLQFSSGYVFTWMFCIAAWLATCKNNRTLQFYTLTEFHKNCKIGADKSCE